MLLPTRPAPQLHPTLLLSGSHSVTSRPIRNFQTTLAYLLRSLPPTELYAASAPGDTLGTRAEWIELRCRAGPSVTWVFTRVSRTRIVG
jgi:hypothetical protein